MTDHSLPRTESLGIPEVLNAVRLIASNWLKRRRLSRLEELDDQTLNDIGIERGDIASALLLPLSVDPVYALNHRQRHCGLRGQRRR